MRNILLLTTTVSAMAFTAQVGHAQASQESKGVEEIIVTAQRRQENMQDVPIAITALTQTQLQASGIVDTSDLKSSIPSLNFTQNQVYSVINLRGIGAGGGGGGIENSVATYIDGVYIGSMTGVLFKLNDIEQVAVLKGPQGTLFGRNATGGVVQVTTRSPQQAFAADVQLTGANLGTYGGSAFLTGGLADDLTASISLYYNDQTDGFGTNLFNGKDVYKSRDFAGRAKLLWTPGDSTRLTLSLDYSNTKSAGPGFATAPGTVNNIGESHVGSPWDVNLDTQPDSKVWQAGTSLTVQQDLGEHVRLLSITAYRQDQMTAWLDTDGTQRDTLRTFGRLKDRQFSQELQLQSLGEGKLKWVLGLYYLKSDARWDPVQVYTGGSRAPYIYLLADEDTKSLAGFAQATYEILPDTNLTGGIRYTHDERVLVNSRQVRLGSRVLQTLPGVNPGQADKKFERVTWRASIDHRFSPEFLAYASFNTGFKGGFFNTTKVPAQLIKPEYVTAYEAGIKTDLFDRRLRFNLAAFRYKYSNIQVFYINNGVTGLLNGEGAKAYGVDADLTWRITPDLTLTGGASWLHGRYTSFLNALCTVPKAGGGNGGCNGSPTPTFDYDATDNKMQLAPDYTLSAGFTYQLPTAIFPTSMGTLSISAHDYYNGGWYADPQNRLKQKGYNIVDASVTWTMPDERWDIRLWGKNLGNTAYGVGINSTDAGDNVQMASGRTYGMTVSAHF